MPPLNSRERRRSSGDFSFAWQRGIAQIGFAAHCRSAFLTVEGFMKARSWLAVMMPLLIVVGIESVSAQNFVMQGRAAEKTNIGLRFMHPNFSNDFLNRDLSTFSGAYDFWVNVPVSGGLNLVAAIPVNAMSADGLDGQTAVGDVYVGIQTRSASPDRSTTFSLGVNLPTASEDDFFAAILGLNTNFHEFRRSLPDVLTIYTNFAHQIRPSTGPLFGFEIGPEVLIPTEDGGDAEVFAHYGVKGGVQLSNVALFAELLGIAIISEDVEDFGDRFNHSIDFGAQMTGYTVNPGIFYLLPLDKDQRDSLDGVLGLKVDFTLP